MTELAVKAYSAFEVKALDSDRRTFSGWATTPSLDRVGDRINPLGARFAKSIPLLHGHNHSAPIGTATFGKPTQKGIPFDAEIPVVSEEYGSLKDRVDTAWGELKYGMVRAVSIGFRALKYSFTDTGVDYEEIEIYELSTVAIPALPDAVITAVKSGAPLPRSFVQQLSRAEAVKAMGAVPLISKAVPAKPDLGGAVRLVSS
jgi:HK97 family phage prohead protease